MYPSALYLFYDVGPGQMKHIPELDLTCTIGWCRTCMWGVVKQEIKKILDAKNR